MWRQHPARLAGRFHCLAPDLPGFGHSNQLPSASVLESADLVAELIQTRVPAQRAHLVAMSWGGGVAHALLVRLAITLVSPFLHTRPVMALFIAMIGMDQEGRAELRASSRRAFWEGFKPPPFRVAIGAPCRLGWSPGSRRPPSGPRMRRWPPSAVERLLRQIEGEPSYANDPRARAR